MKIQINEENRGSRLDVFMALQLGLSRNSVQHFIESSQILLNGKKESSSTKLKIGDEISYETLETPKNDHILPENIPLSIIYEDKDLLVIDKAVGMVVHPGAGVTSGTVSNAVMYYLGLTEESLDIRMGLVHRLDKDTSGVLLVAKNPVALDYYSSLFEHREVEKMYVCIVDEGISKEFKKGDFKIKNSKGKVIGQVKNLSENEILVSGFMGRSLRDRKKMSLQESGSKDALKYSETRFKLVDDHMLEAYPKTGRTHQLRVHLSSIGFPIWGDLIYSGKTYERLMLHAHKVNLKLMDGTPMEFLSELPSIFKTAQHEISKKT